MTVEPSCPKCGSREHFELMEWPLKSNFSKDQNGIFVYCSKCGTAINWIPK